MMRTTTSRRTISNALLVVSISVLLWAAMTSIPRLASAQQVNTACGMIKPGMPCGNGGGSGAFGSGPYVCKVDTFTATGAPVMQGLATCYPPSSNQPPNTVPCTVVVASGWGTGWCNYPGMPPTGSPPTASGPPVTSQPPTTVPPPPPTPPPAPPVVTGASCTHSPPSRWYDINAVVGPMAPSWLTRAKDIASGMTKTLFVFEIFMIGALGLIHRHDITHFLSGFAFKTFVATFFLYLIANAPSILPATFSSLGNAGASMGFPAANSSASTAMGNTVATGIYDQIPKTAELFFCAAMASHIDDQESAIEYGHFGNMLGTAGAVGTPGAHDYVNTIQGAIGHITFEFLVQGLGMLVIAAGGIMFLAITLVTAESYITWYAGVFFIGFSFTRFTLPFTQGYLAYSVNVGVKLLTMWLLLAVNSAVLLPILKTAGTRLIEAASIQFGAQSGQSEEFYLVSAAVDVTQMLAMAGLMWFLPNVMARFVSKRNSASAINVITGLASSLKGSSLAVAGPSNSMLPGPVSPAQLFQGPMHVTPSKEHMTSIVQPAAAPPAARLGNPFPSEAQAFISPSSPTSTAAASAAASIDNGATISGIYNQPVQASVSDGPDPFAIKPKIEPIVVSIQPRMTRSVANPLIKNHTEDETTRQNTVAEILKPNTTIDSGIPNTIFQQRSGINAPFSPAPANPSTPPKNTRTRTGATPSTAPLEDLPLVKEEKNPAATLAPLSPEQMKLLPPEEFALLLEATQWNTLNAEQLETIEGDERLRTPADQVIPQRRRAPETS